MGLLRITNMDRQWVDHLKNIVDHGQVVSPRGLKCKELNHTTYAVPMHDCVLTLPERKLNYRFMAAEAYWILSGDDTVKGIAPYNPNISQFSDNGEVFFGAYGPKVVNQIDYVVDILSRDIQTRQAVISIWRENPPKTKDVPCTISLVFQVRRGVLDCHAFMRSSDAWLGLPYDTFNFSMISAYVLAGVRSKVSDMPLILGTLYITMVSAHLYESDYNKAVNVITGLQEATVFQGDTSFPVGRLGTKIEILEELHAIRDSKPGDTCRWWEG